jgi:hypothetical protein
MYKENFSPTLDEILSSQMEAESEVSIGKMLNIIWLHENPLQLPTNLVLNGRQIGIPMDEYAEYAYWSYNVWKISGDSLEFEEIQEVVKEAFRWMAISDASDRIDGLSNVLFEYLTSITD